MKHAIYLLGLTSAIFMGCTDHEMPTETQQEISRQTIIAQMPQPGSNSRVSIQNKGSILWTPGDAFIAFNETYQKAKFVLDDIEYVSKGKFSSTDEVEGKFINAAFPSYALPEFDGTNISFVFPKEYGVDQNTDNSAMWGEIVNNNVTFHHLMSVLKVNVSILPYEYNKIVVEADKPIAGKFTQTVADVAKGLIADKSNTDKTNNTITITRSLTKGEVYVSLPAGTYAQVSIKALNGTDATTAPKMLAEVKNKTIKCGYMYSVGHRGIDEKVFSLLNLDYPGLSEVKASYNNGEIKKAAEALLNYYRNRTNVKNPEIQNLSLNNNFRNIANQALEYRFTVSKFVEDDKGTPDKSDDIFYSFKKNDGSINWGYKPNVAGVDREFLYQQHRHQWMEPQAKTYAVTKNEEYVKSWIEVYSSWMKKYPCPNKAFSDPKIYDLEPGYEWKALQTAQRVNAQLNSVPLFIQSPNFPAEFFTTVLTAFAESVEMIRMNYISDGNIRLTQGEAVAKAGLLMPEFKNSDEWIQDGLQKMDIDEQFLADGIHFDLCFGYHMGALSSFVKMNSLAIANNRHDVFSPEYISKLKNAISFVEAMIYPDYTVDNFNDSHSSSYPKSTLQNRLRDYLAIFPDDEELKWLAYEGSRGGTKPTWQNRAFSTGGYYMLKSNNWSSKTGLMVIHTNNYNPTRKWHCQQDNGTFSLWYNGTNFLPDAGYYTYNDPDPTGMRQKYRSYTMHNTMSCFGKEISDYRQQGKMLKQESGKDYELIVTENMPYKKGDQKDIDGDIYHRRAIYMVDNKFVVLVDEGHSVDPISIKLNLNFHLFSEKGKKATIVSQPDASNKFGLVKTNLSKNNIVMKFFSETGSGDFKIDNPSDIKVSDKPGTTIGEARDFIRVTDRKNKNQGAARFITVIYPSAGPADTSKGINARFTDNEAGKEGTFHTNGAAIEVTVDGKTYNLAYSL